MDSKRGEVLSPFTLISQKEQYNDKGRNDKTIFKTNLCAAPDVFDVGCLKWLYKR